MTFKIGDIVRYSPGSTAFFVLEHNYNGRWYGTHCLCGSASGVESNFARPTKDELVFVKGLLNEVFDKAINNKQERLNERVNQ